MPVSVFSNKGKKQINAVMMTVDVIPKPNQIIKRGPRASLGITWLARIYGHNNSLKNLFSPRNSPDKNPKEQPITKPSTISADVTQICTQR